MDCGGGNGHGPHGSTPLDIESTQADLLQTIPVPDGAGVVPCLLRGLAAERPPYLSAVVMAFADGQHLYEAPAAVGGNVSTLRSAFWAALRAGQAWLLLAVQRVARSISINATEAGGRNSPRRPDLDGYLRRRCTGLDAAA